MEDRRQNNTSNSSNEVPEHASSQASTSERVLNSASSLLCDAIHPSTMQGARTFSDALTSEGKAGPSTPLPSAMSSAVSEQCGGVTNRRRRQALPYLSDAFREPLASKRKESNPTGFLDETTLGNFTDRSHLDSVPSLWQWDSDPKGKERVPNMDTSNEDNTAADLEWTSAWKFPKFESMRTHSVLPALHASRPICVPEGVEEDGADVLKLLQDPDFSPWTDNVEEQEAPFTTESGWSTTHELVHRTDSAMKPRASIRESTATRTKGTRGLSPPPSFFDNIENYQEKVWFFDQPLAEEETRTTVSEPSLCRQEPATRRLRMLAGHLDEYRL
jgi:hypothetical protein